MDVLRHSVYQLFALCVMFSVYLLWKYNNINPLSSPYMFNNIQGKKLVALPFKRQAGIIVKNDTKQHKHDIVSQVFPTSNTKATLTVTNKPHKRYVLPVHQDPNGPNCQYQAFRGGMKFAIQENRTLVEMWFSNHRNSGRNYRGFRYVNETFDVQRIREVVDLVTIEKFKEDCNGTATAILMIPPLNRMSLDDITKDYETRTSRFTTRYGIKLPGANIIPKTREEAILNYVAAKDVKCLALFEPDRITKVDVPERLTTIVDSHLLRTKEIRRLGKEISEQICSGNPYIALHWRNKTGETRQNNQTNNRNIRLTAEVLLKDIKTFMEERNYSCIYVAFPPYSMALVELLSKENISRPVTRSDILDESFGVAISETIKSDNYFTALLEQEICLQSAVFFSASSSLSHNVINQRNVYGKESQRLMKFVSWVAPGVYLKRKK